MSLIAETKDSSMLASMDAPPNTASSPPKLSPATASSPPQPPSTTASSRPESSHRDDAAERPPYFTPREPQARASDPFAPTTCKSPSCTLNPTEATGPILPEAQRRWAARPLTERLQPIRKARHSIAAHPEAFAQAISPILARSQSDTLIAEVLPLLDAMRFLERNAHQILRPRKLGKKHRPLWLTGIQAEVHRDPLGHILVIGPANFPLFLPGVQTLQALAAGNAVTWKPGSGGGKVAALLAHVLREAGLPRGILQITGDSVEAAGAALAQKPDKVIFTGSFDTGRHILRSLAETATPSVMELSGADAVVVLPSADLPLAARAIAFGLRLNGAQVCMSPRRLIAPRETLDTLRPLLIAELARVPPVSLLPRTAETLRNLLNTAQLQASNLKISALEPAQKHSAGTPPATWIDQSTPSQDLQSTRPILVDGATPDMAITRTDLFAPILSLIEAPSVLHIADLVNNNPFGLSAAIFGNSREAQTLANQLRVGAVTINDLIAPTADPRIPFGGRADSGFGATRGAEGLLEMTAAKTVLTRRKGTSLHYDPLHDRDLPLFASLIGALHAGSLAHRWHSLKQLITATRTKH